MPIKRRGGIEAALRDDGTGVAIRIHIKRLSRGICVSASSLNVYRSATPCTLNSSLVVGRWAGSGSSGGVLDYRCSFGGQCSINIVEMK